MNNQVLKVSSKSNPNSLAGAITGVLNEKGKVEVQAVGAGAINQAVKGIAVARGFVAAAGINLVCIPAFSTVIIEGEERTGMKFIVREDK